MAAKKSNGPRKFTKQDLSFNFGANVKSKGKGGGGKRKPAGGGSVPSRGR